MNRNELTYVLETTPEHPAQLEPDTVDVTHGDLLEHEREDVREALVAAAVPHWCDANLLASLLNCGAGHSAAMIERLRGFRVVERCAADEGTIAVQAASRRALRACLQAEDEERFRALSARAQAHFSALKGDDAHVETVYHRFTAEPEAAARDCGRLYDEWHHSGHHAPLLKLADVLEELEQAGLPSGLVRGRALDVSGCIRANYRRVEEPLEPLAERARVALAEFQAYGDERLILVAQSQLGSILSDLGDLEGALAASTAYRDLAQRQAEAAPEDAASQRSLALAHNKIGDVLFARGDVDGALAAYGASLTIGAGLLQLDPASPFARRDLSVTHGRIGDVYHAQARYAEALAAHIASRNLRLQLLEREPAHPGWLDDLAASHNRIALALDAQGDKSGALATHRDTLAILERLAGHAPDQARWQIELAGAYANVADTLRQLPAARAAGAPNPHGEARELLGRARGILDSLTSTHEPLPEEQALRSFLDELEASLAG